MTASTTIYVEVAATIENVSALTRWFYTTIY